MVTTPQSATQTAPLTRGAKKNGRYIVTPWLPQMRELAGGLSARLREGNSRDGDYPSGFSQVKNHLP